MRKFINLLLIITCITDISLAQVNEHDISSFSLDSLLNVKLISASTHWQKTFEAPSYVSIITSDEIDKFGYHSLDVESEKDKGSKFTVVFQNKI